MRVFLICFLAFIGFHDLMAQGPIENLQKYNFYRQRFDHAFIAKGRSQGQSIPFLRRTYGQDDAIPDKHLSNGDNPLHTGFYIAMLSTEIKLLSLNNQPTEASVLDLCLALDQINRLDYLSSVLMGGVGLEIPLNAYPATIELDGFLVRDDTPLGFENQNPGLMNGGGYSMYSVTEGYGDYIQKGFDCSINSFRNEMSKDHLYGLASGLIIALKSIPPNLSASPIQFGTFLDGESNVRQEVINILERLFGMLKDHKFKIYNEHCDECAYEASQSSSDPCNFGKGGNALEKAYPLAWIAHYWLGHPMEDYLQNNVTSFGPNHKPDALFNWQIWQAMVSPYLLNQIENLPDELEKQGRRELKHISRVLALTKSKHDISNFSIAAFESYYGAYLMQLNPLFIFLSSLFVGSQAVEPIFYGAPWNPAQSLLMLPDNNLSPEVTSLAVKDISEFSHQEIDYLIHGYLFDEQIESTSNTFFEWMLNSAPCEGLYNFYPSSIDDPNREYYQLFSQLPPNIPLCASDPNWATINRWENFSDHWFDNLRDSDSNNDFLIPVSLTGEFSGMDYMLLFNLYCLNNPSYLNGVGGYNLQNHIMPEISGVMPVLPINHFSHASPGYAYSYDRMNVHAWLLPDAHLEAKAATEIHLSNGFAVEPGGYFHGYIATPECVNGIFKSATVLASDSISSIGKHYRVYPKTISVTEKRELNYQKNFPNHNFLSKIMGESDGFVLYPNPANDRLHVVLPSHDQRHHHQVRVYNNPGQVLYRTSRSSANLEIPLSSLAEGHYFIEVFNEEGIWVKPFIVKH